MIRLRIRMWVLLARCTLLGWWLDFQIWRARRTVEKLREDVAKAHAKMAIMKARRCY